MRRDDDPKKHFKKRGNTKFCFLDLCFFSSGVKALQSTTVGPISLIFSPFYLHFHTNRLPLILFKTGHQTMSNAVLFCFFFAYGNISSKMDDKFDKKPNLF